MKRILPISLKLNFTRNTLGCNGLIWVQSCSQVWFQNKRSKERRLKQLTSMGRGPFYAGSRKMRGFAMNMGGAGLEDAPPGFPYFAAAAAAAAAADGKFDFGYAGPPPFHHDFFPPHHTHAGPPGQGLPFPQGKHTALSARRFWSKCPRRWL